MADTYNSWQAGLYSIGAATALGDAYAQSQSLKSQSSFQRTMAAINARLANEQASQVESAGNTAAAKIMQKGRQIHGAGRAAAAAQGLDPSDGSSSEVIQDSDAAAIQDSLNTKNNAWREAWGIRTQGALNQVSSNMEASGKEFAANQTLLTGGLKALSNAGMAAAYASGYTKKGNEDRSGSINGYSGSWTPRDYNGYLSSGRLNFEDK